MNMKDVIVIRPTDEDYIQVKNMTKQQREEYHNNLMKQKEKCERLGVEMDRELRRKLNIFTSINAEEYQFD